MSAHTVRLEPVGETLAVEPGETILDAAFRQGLNLAYGCREGQCSACKCFLLEGEATLTRYSNFALSDSELASGYSLMCRAMPDEDLVVELLHVDEENLRLEHAIADGAATVEAVEALTPDITRLVLRAEGDFDFTPGQYVDLHVPGADDGARRSFSLVNLPGEGRIELIIKRYPGGRFSGLLESGIAPGERITFTGPYGSLRLRDSDRPILMIAGGSGMAPILALLRQLARDGCGRPVRFFFGARTAADLYLDEEIAAIGEGLADFRYTAVVERFVHEAVDEYLREGEIAAPDVYLCGPPPMIEAAEEMLTGVHGLDEGRLFADRFTTSADAGGEPAPAAAGPPVKRLETTPAPADEAERDFAWFAPRGRRASLYEDVTVDTQPSVHRHLTRGWPVSFADGRGTWNDNSTALRCTDWYAFRDPGEQWERPFYQWSSALENQVEGTLRSARAEGLMDDFDPGWVEFLRANLQVPAFVEHGLWFALATIGRDCLSDSVATCVCLQAATKQRSAQALVLYAMDLEQHHGPFPIQDAREHFLTDPRWQPTRRYLERLAATPDWGEVIVAANLCFEPRVGTLLRREVGIRAAARNGDTVTPVLARVATEEWEWARGWSAELVAMLVGDPQHGEHNRETIEGWLGEWEPAAIEAAEALAELAAVDGESLGGYADRLLEQAGVVTGDVAGFYANGAAAKPAPKRRVRPSRTPRRPSSTATGAADGTGYDYVGIVMAKSAEGDAVADILRGHEGIDVIEQPSFWDIRARDRMEISYAEVSDRLGYEIDAYSIQHEMSTHYGRMVTTDEALMLFSDPTEAMAHLMS